MKPKMTPKMTPNKPKKVRRNRRIQPRKKVNANRVSLRIRVSRSADRWGAVFRTFALGVRMVSRMGRQKLASLRLGEYARAWNGQVAAWMKQRGWPLLVVGVRLLGTNLRALFSKERRRKIMIQSLWVRAELHRLVRALRNRKGLPVGEFIRHPRQWMTFFDPRVVRLEAPNRFLLHSLMITLLFTGIAVTAFAVAASVKQSPSTVEDDIASGSEDAIATESLTADAAREAWLEEGDAAKVKKNTPSEKKPTALPSDFYNPIYVFTQAQPKQVRVYPLATPPGIVVNIQGIEEPEESAEQMVGEDERIQKVKRVVTSTGVRYIIRLTYPIQRIEGHVEGNVITVSPLE
ncbi:MAG: hypothetical protein JXX29_07070 [Deltaproteobacteria bacterium]|nr:hypothetical protein [Deltaproteobacteria bacterium]MBN2671415.1 hypothetical protein [Deltaproteobacteria bacterium]